MQINFSEFKNSVKANDLRSIYLFEGEDAFFRQRGIFLIKNACISELDLNYKSFDGEEADITEVLSSIEAFPFLSEKRLTVIKEFYPDKNQLKGKLKDLLEKPFKDSIFIISNSKPCESLKKFEQVVVVDCKKADASTITKWIEAEGNKLQIKVEREASSKLAEYCLFDMARIETEVNKVLSYAIKDGVVKEETIDLLVSRDSEYKIYEMTDYIGKKKFEKALFVIKEMMAKGETPQRLIISIYNYYRRLLHVAISDMTNLELAKLLEIKEFAVKKAKEQSKMFSKRALKKATDTLIDADYKAKSGQMDFSEGFWLSVFKIMVEG